MPSLGVIHIVDALGEHFDDRAIDAVFEQTPSLVIWSSFGCPSPHTEGATVIELKDDITMHTIFFCKENRGSTIGPQSANERATDVFIAYFVGVSAEKRNGCSGGRVFGGVIADGVGIWRCAWIAMMTISVVSMIGCPPSRCLITRYLCSLRRGRH